MRKFKPLFNRAVRSPFSGSNRKHFSPTQRRHNTGYREERRRELAVSVVLLLGLAPCREADIKSCIVLACLPVRVCVCVCMLIDWLTQLYGAPL